MFFGSGKGSKQQQQQQQQSDERPPDAGLPSYGESVENSPRPGNWQQQQQQHPSTSAPAASSSSPTWSNHNQQQQFGAFLDDATLLSDGNGLEAPPQASSSLTSFFSSSRDKKSGPGSSTSKSSSLKERERERDKKRASAILIKETNSGSSNAAAKRKDPVTLAVERIPPEAQKALAPLQLQSDTKDLMGVYNVELSNETSVTQTQSAFTTVSPTCNLVSNGRSDVDITLYFRPPPPPPLPARTGFSPGLYTTTYGHAPINSPAATAPLEILAKLKKGKLRLTIPEKLPIPKPLRIICTLESGNAYIFLPVNFDGKLAIWAPAGTIELSEPLKRNSTIIPSTTDNAYITVYRIVPSPEVSKLLLQQATNDDSDGQSSSDQARAGATVMDLCQINAAKGRVRVEYAKPPRGAGGGDCVIQ